MSGIDERQSLQCPLCDRNANPTQYWSGYVGAFRNWCHLNIDDRIQVRDLERRHLQTRVLLQSIDSVKCRSRGGSMGLLERHRFLPDTLVFKHVKAKILYHDALMRQEEES